MAAGDGTNTGHTGNGCDHSREDFPDFLDLNGWRMLKREKRIVEFRNPKTHEIETHIEYLVTVELTQKSSRCLFCQEEGGLHTLRLDDQDVRDQPIRKVPCMLHVKRPYYRCQICGQLWSELLPHIDTNRQMTLRLREHIWDDGFRKSHALIATETGVGAKTIREILYEGFAVLDRARRIELPAHLYFDDINLSPKKCYSGLDPNVPIKERKRASCGDGNGGVPIEIFEKCDIDLVIKFFAQFTEEQLAQVKYFTMDLSEFSESVGTKCVPAARRLADHYHVKKMVNDHFDEFRKMSGNAIKPNALKAAKEQGINDEKELKKIESSAEEDKKKLRRNRFSLQKRVDHREDQDRKYVEMFCLADDVLEKALAEKDALFSIWDETADSTCKMRKYKMQSSAAAEEAYREWVKGLSGKTKLFWGKLLNSFERWAPEIFGFFDVPITNSPAETEHSIMRAMNQRGRDYGFRMIRGMALYRHVRSQDVPWDDEGNGDPTAASRKRTLKAAERRKAETKARHLRQQEQKELTPVADMASSPAPRNAATQREMPGDCMQEEAKEAATLKPIAFQPVAGTLTDSRADGNSDSALLAKVAPEYPQTDALLDEAKVVPVEAISRPDTAVRDGDTLLCVFETDCELSRLGCPCLLFCLKSSALSGAAA
jgi:transposase